MLIALAIAAAVSPAVEAERAFAARAQVAGQWTAFREFAAARSVMFVPQEVQAQDWLKGRADPPVPVMWWPAQAYVGCDGSTAVTTGPWVRDGGRLKGYFTTVWVREDDGKWRWVLDHGDALAAPRRAADAPSVRRASCRGKPSHSSNPVSRNTSPDLTLNWTWNVAPDGSRTVRAAIWNGRGYDELVHDKVAAE